MIDFNSDAGSNWRQTWRDATDAENEAYESAWLDYLESLPTCVVHNCILEQDGECLQCTYEYNRRMDYEDRDHPWDDEDDSGDSLCTTRLN